MPQTAAKARARVSNELLRSALFLTSITLPLLATPFGRFAESVNAGGASRNPTSLFGAVTSEKSSFRDWFSENFGFRNPLTYGHSKFKVNGFKSSPSDRVVLGKDGWLFMASELSIEDYRCSLPFSDGELRHWAAMLEERHNWLAKRGSRYLFVIAPSKHTIYPEYMPDQFKPHGSVSRQDQLLTYLREHSRVSVVDLRPALRAAKLRGRLYHQTDTHWNDLGAFFAEAEIARSLKQWFPRLKPNQLSSYHYRTERRPGGDLARFMLLQDEMQEETVTLASHGPGRVHQQTEYPPASRSGVEVPYSYRVFTSRDAAPIPSVVVFCDSFSGALAPFLGEHFQRGVFQWAHEFDKELLEQEKPQVVIDEWVERLLMAPRQMVR